MHRDGHIGIVLVMYAPIAFVLSWLGLVTPMLLGLVGVAVMSYAPDVDLRVPLVAHRGITHSALAAVVAGLAYAGIGVSLAATGGGASGDAAVVIGSPLAAQLAAATFGFLVGALGVASHLVGDMLTPMGIEPWQPVDDTSYSLEVVTASNLIANKAFALAGGVAIVAALAAGTTLRTGTVPL